MIFILEEHNQVYKRFEKILSTILLLVLKYLREMLILKVSTVCFSRCKHSPSVSESALSTK